MKSENTATWLRVLFVAAFLTAIVCAIALAHAEEEPPGVYFARDRGQLVQSTTTEIRSSNSVVQMVTAAAQRHGVPVNLAHGVIRIESGYRCSARNGGAIGIGQVFRATARSVGVYGNLFDCSTGLEASMRYLKLAINMHGSGCAGVSAYERGVYAPGRCTGYGRKVIAMGVRP
ncbi:LT_GEWL domain containing protein [uncultured Caudovirales phage]|uniref:LT_GEWL domain containing protein n=1 Tax=uncultured Caudovirales phage TaxID=2100421 RepID=A0A6J5QZM4_9CAUD|nr:LT_GEWL domain containing protein [uncultured Caudovirales phage]CAB4176909.1 LT_GEWL domain containing protein [uncultured Caudovirales phage]CAB4189853.1 LT_GEWL domain containing protein [uncultured Caudovirales phage]